MLAELDSVSMGKPVAFGIRDAMYGAACIRHAAALAESYVGGTATTNAPGRFDFSLKQPYGVVAAICRELVLMVEILYLGENYTIYL